MTSRHLLLLLLLAYCSCCCNIAGRCWLSMPVAVAAAAAAPCGRHFSCRHAAAGPAGHISCGRSSSSCQCLGVDACCCCCQAQRLDLLQQLLLVALHDCSCKLVDLSLQLLLNCAHHSTQQLARCTELQRLLLLRLLAAAEAAGECGTRGWRVLCLPGAVGARAGSALPLLLVLLLDVARWRGLAAAACSWYVVALLVADVSTDRLHVCGDPVLDAA